eukprot:6711224-Pyramimonas_sp.AAC.1
MNMYTASCQMVKHAFLRAFPEEAGDLAKYGGGSPRKLLAEVSWPTGVPGPPTPFLSVFGFMATTYTITPL